jgi:hypothetical protein
MYADTGGNNALAVRPFTGGALDAGQVFSVNFDNGYIRPGGQVAVGFWNALNSTVFAVAFIGGSAFYEYNDANGTFTIGLGYGDEGLNLTVTMTGATNYFAKLTQFDGASATWSGSMNSAPVASLRKQTTSAPVPRTICLSTACLSSRSHPRSCWSRSAVSFSRSVVNRIARNHRIDISAHGADASRLDPLVMVAPYS